MPSIKQVKIEQIMKNKYFSNQERHLSEQQFNELLQQIENSVFISDSLLITSTDYEEMLPKGAVDIDDERTVLLANALKRNVDIKNLDLTNNNIGDKGAIALAGVSSLERLNLWGNNIGAIGAKYLAKSNLKELHLGENRPVFDKTPVEIAEVANAFSNNKTTIDLNFYNCDIPDMMINQIIKNNKTIKKLTLNGCHLTDDALRYIEYNTVLEHLYLHDNNITDLGAKYISQNHSLIDIDFGNNPNLTERGARFLSNHPTLKNIILNSTVITIEQLKEAYPQEDNWIGFENNDTNLSGDVEYERLDDAY